MPYCTSNYTIFTYYFMKQDNLLSIMPMVEISVDLSYLDESFGRISIYIL